jgi:uncharacterized tellurite resistance protein B-like protein
MGSADLFKALTQTLDSGTTDVALSEDVTLTPYLAVVVAILYMMAVDGDISDKESSQLQSVIGTDDHALRRAVAYAQTHEVDQFLTEAPLVLDADARQCLLINVADSLMADGEMQKVELALFDRMLSAFAHTKASFQSHFDAIAAKGKTSVLGDFAAAGSTDAMTPPKALVVAMLYMISADGSMASEEIGRLSVTIGGHQALLKASLRYVSQVRPPQFLTEIAGMLDKRQRLCVLLNVCDAMMSDRKVVVQERELFGRILEAFGVSAASLDTYLSTLRIKNDVPHDDVQSTTLSMAMASAKRSTTPRPEGVIFERKRTWQEETGEGGGENAAEAAVTARRDTRDKGAASLDSRISRTMQDNIDRMSQGLDDEPAIAGLESSARSGAVLSPVSRRGDGPADVRATANHKDGPEQLRAVRDAQGPVSRRAATDGETGSGSKARSPNGGAKDVRATQDGSGPADLRTVRDRDGPSEQRAEADAAGPATQRSATDAGATTLKKAMQDARLSDASHHWKDADVPGERRALRDASGPALANHWADDRRAFDRDVDDGVDGLIDADESSERMQAVSERTNHIRGHVDAMQRSRSLRAGSRMPSLLHFRPAAEPARSVTASTDAVVPQLNDGSESMLLSADEGGPRMSEPAAPASQQDAQTHRRLRLRSAVLLPALFVTYGATMVGETLSERLFITNQSSATDAQIVHQMASVQQSVYRITPDAVQLLPGAIAAPVAVNAVSPGTAADPTGVASSDRSDSEAMSDREKADDFLEQRKKALQEKFQQHQSSSALAAERQQWFVYAKSIVLLGLGMAFWGVLFRSLQMLHASTASGLVGLLLTANGYWLFLRF